ncbi:MAG: RNA polymerase sigma factor [Planctomycetota bacterium]
MAPRGQTPHAGLTADEFSARFQAGARVFWTLAAGLVGDPIEAEDVCQEAYLAAHDKRAQFDPATNFQAWMGRFVRNVAANERRKRARRRTEPSDPFVLDESGPAPAAADERLFDPEAFDERLLAALGTLGEVPRACLLLRVLREQSYAEIATLLEIPEGTAMSHVHRARTALRAFLEDSGT